MIKRMLPLLLAGLVLAACGGNTAADNPPTPAASAVQPASAPAVAEASAAVPDMHNAQNALDWNGTYQGLLPCASCEGIATELVLNDDGTYRLQPRENFDAGLPLCLLALESKAMIRDRVYGVKETMYHDPYYQRHVVGTPRILSVVEGEGGTVIEAEANYVVLRTKRDGMTEVFNAGRYRDEIVRTPEGLKFRARLCVYDSEMIPNSVIYPI